jgi:Tol biopolymer transport system component
MTRAGVILGTAAYMAPEQARGKAVDQRADIWAFGCVLFEMLTARRAFPGEEMPDVLARVIQSDPDWKLIPASTPPAVVTLLHRCLRKDPARRLHSIADGRIDLEEIGVAGPATPTAPTARRSWWVPAIGGAAIGALITAMAMLFIRAESSAPSPAGVLRLAAPLPEGWTLFRSANGRLHLAVSPDGEKLAVVAVKDGGLRVLVRRLDEPDFRELPGTDGATSVFWAPDSQRLGFLAGSGFRRVELSGAGSQHMAVLNPSAGNAAWGVRDEVLATGGIGRPLFRFPATGGTPAPIGDLPPKVVNRGWASWLPDDRGYLFFDRYGMRSTLQVQPPEGAAHLVAEMESLAGSLVTAQYGSGYILIARIEPIGTSVLTAQRFDLQTLRPVGQSAVVLNDLNPAFSVSNTAVLAFAQSTSVNEQFMWLDARGATSAMAAESQQTTNFDLSPDERSMVIQLSGGGLMLHDLVRGVTTRIHSEGTDPIWSRDGKRIAFSVNGSTDRGIHVMPAFGGPSEITYKSADIIYLEDWSRDGKWLAGHVALGVGRPGILIPVSASDKPIMFAGTQTSGADLKNLTDSVDETRFSPDGQWLAYGLLGSPSQVFLVHVPPTGERWQVSVAGGAQPRWRADGRALYFLSLSGTLMMVDLDLDSGGPPQISPPRSLFETGLQVMPGLDQFAVSADGKRFLVRRPVETRSALRQQVEVIVNWPGLLKGTP